MKLKLPESYIRLKPYATLVEEICRDIDLHAFGFDPGVSFHTTQYHYLELPEWFLERLYKYVYAPASPLPNAEGDTE